MFELAIIAVAVLPYFGYLAVNDYNKIKHRYEMSVTLPNASTIKTRLCEAHLSDFAENTYLISQLANKKTYPYNVEQIVAHNVTAYNFSKGMPFSLAITDTNNTQRITEIILKDHPTAIAKLKSDRELEAVKVIKVNTSWADFRSGKNPVEQL